MSGQRLKGLAAVGRYIARMLRAVAATLDPGLARSASRDETADAELEQLRLRYPDAPASWLRMVARQGGAEAMQGAGNPAPPDTVRRRNGGRPEIETTPVPAARSAEHVGGTSFHRTASTGGAKRQVTPPRTPVATPTNIRPAPAQPTATIARESTRRYVGPLFHAARIDRPDNRTTPGPTDTGLSGDLRLPGTATISPVAEGRERHERSVEFGDRRAATVGPRFTDAVTALQRPGREMEAVARPQIDSLSRTDPAEPGTAAAFVEPSECSKTRNLRLPVAVQETRRAAVEIFAESPRWPQLPDAPAQVPARDDGESWLPVEEETDRWNALPF